MSSVRGWMTGQRPAPPPELAARMADAVEGEAAGRDDVASVLAERGVAGLDEARRAPGRVRESAYRLLTADALLTYACLAALDAPDPRPFLEELVGRTISPDR